MQAGHSSVKAACCRYGRGLPNRAARRWGGSGKHSKAACWLRVHCMCTSQHAEMCADRAVRLTLVEQVVHKGGVVRLGAGGGGGGDGVAPARGGGAGARLEAVLLHDAQVPVGTGSHRKAVQWSASAAGWPGVQMQARLQAHGTAAGTCCNKATPPHARGAHFCRRSRCVRRASLES